MAASQKERSIDDHQNTRNAVMGMEGSDIENENEQHSPYSDERVGGREVFKRDTSTTDSSHVTTFAQKSNTHNSTIFLATNIESDRSKVPKAEPCREETLNIPINNVGLSSAESGTIFSVPLISLIQPVSTSSTSTKGASSGEVAYSSVGRMVGGNVAGEAVWQPVIPVAVGPQSSSSTCSLSKALIENERKKEKERLTKQNRLSKVCLFYVSF